MAAIRTTPPTAPRRKRVAKSPEDRRAALIRGAGRVFREKGFAAATVAELAEAGEVAKGTFYLYFDSKDHLLGAMWEEYVDGFLRSTQELLETDGDWWPTLDRLIRALVDHAVDNAALHRIVYGSANAKALELCRTSNQRVVDVMVAFVRRGARAGVFRAYDPTLVCRMLFHAADGLLDDLISRGEQVDPEVIVAAVRELTHRGLGDTA
ncbi:TetR/AcrR family transcriptional regulator [Streptomyces sp. R21]|uniref:TetR/AcrR family transcriptional regulator n=1 Tax=Streptomyces sp. R21 TaxID=3238627 RepID=A0AB39P2Y1_9ACTN